MSVKGHEICKIKDVKNPQGSMSFLYHSYKHVCETLFGPNITK